MRIFLDTNVVVSGFTTRGLCADLIREVLANHTLITSEDVLGEIEEVLLHRFAIPAGVVMEILTLLRRQEIVALPDPLPELAIRDPDDLAIVAAAIASRADFLVSGDQDITSLDLREVRVATPRALWDAISKIRDA